MCVLFYFDYDLKRRVTSLTLERVGEQFFFCLKEYLNDQQDSTACGLWGIHGIKSFLLVWMRVSIEIKLKDAGKILEKRQ